MGWNEIYFSGWAVSALFFTTCFARHYGLRSASDIGLCLFLGVLCGGSWPIIAVAGVCHFLWFVGRNLVDA